MIVFPNCKINLGLHILRKRSDGFHDLETFFLPLILKDALEVVSKSENAKDGQDVEFLQTGLTIEGEIKNNLCVQAYQLLKNDFSQLPGIKMHLHKTIPAGAGLGGGSSDAAFALNLFNKKYQLGLSTEQLLDYALRLGSDCPFFIINKPCLASRRGEFLERVHLDFSDYYILIVYPNIHISTAWAFSQITPSLRKKTIKEIIQQPIEIWKQDLKNDFEEIVFEKYPEIREIKEKLYESNSIYAGMSGSGSTVYGIFKKNEEVNVSFPKEYFIKKLFSQA